MGRCFVVLLAVILAGAGPSEAQARKPGVPAAPTGFAVQIEQDGALVPAVNHEVHLRQASFAILLHSPDLKGAFLSASFTPELFDLARTGLPFGNLLRSGMTAAEGHGNEERLLFVGEQRLHFLDYEDKSYVRMDQVATVGAGFRGRKTIATLFYEDASHEISKVLPRPIYLVVVRGRPHPETGVIYTSEYEYLKLVFDKGASAANPIPPIQAVPKDLAATFAGALRRMPAFGSAGGRAIQPAMQGTTLPNAPSPVWVVEFQWKEKDALHTGVAMLVDVPALEKHTPGALKELTLREGIWAVANSFEDQTFAIWSERMADVRRSANEAAAVADIRSVISAQEVFKYASGSYGELGCLTAPATCIPGSKEPTLIDARFTAAEKGGYRRSFHPGAPGKGKAKRPLETWAFTAVPMDPSAGRRAFCADSRGLVCAVADGSMPPVVGGACPKTCVVLP